MNVVPYLHHRHGHWAVFALILGLCSCGTQKEAVPDSTDTGQQEDVVLEDIQDDVPTTADEGSSTDSDGEDVPAVDDEGTVVEDAGSEPDTNETDLGEEDVTVSPDLPSPEPDEGTTDPGSPPTDMTPPSVPANFEAYAINENKIQLNWDSSSDEETGISNYIIYRNGVNVGTTLYLSYQDTNLIPGTTYAYRVSALNGDGLESAKSAEVLATTEGQNPSVDTTPPSAPLNLTVESTTPSSVSLAWLQATDLESGVDTYYVYRDGNKVGETTGLSYMDAGLTPETTYGYTVSAVNGEGLEGPATAEIQAYTEEMTVEGVPPGAPPDVAGQPISPTKAQVTWSSAECIDGYVSLYYIYRDGVLVGQTPNLSFTNAGLEPETSYVYEVSAVSSLGLEGPRSEAVTIQTPAQETTPPEVNLPLDDCAEIGSTVHCPGEMWPNWTLEEVTSSPSFYGGLDDYLGTVTFVVFFSTTCPFCKVQSQGLQAMQDELAAEGHDVDFIIVNQFTSPQELSNLTNVCDFPIYQDTVTVRAYEKHGGEQYDMYIYDSTGHLFVYLDASSSFNMTLSSTIGYNNVKTAILSAD
ncbi:MAG: hypothetical protein CMH54_01465 [Myxococcales bacterium]|nr:hypothetical protein [Myxococcales bacterium]|tara:strand:- start:1571 stop:3313 length:1743 start_codon:yes stop_codon:yes gene_type:complete